MTRPPKVLIDNDQAALRYHPAGKIVHHEIRRPISGEPLRDLLMTGLQFFEVHRATKWLADDRGNGALHPDDAKWAIEEWSPRAIDAGWTHLAIVPPDSALGKINMKRFINLYRDRGVKVRVFALPEEALKWLRNADRQTASGRHDRRA